MNMLGSRDRPRSFSNCGARLRFLVQTRTARKRLQELVNMKRPDLAPIENRIIWEPLARSLGFLLALPIDGAAS